MTTDIIVYPGIFDPFTLGHINIAQRATSVFDRVIVAIASDTYKNTMFTFEERVQMAKEIFQENTHIEVDCFHGLLVNYLKKKQSKALLRGIRTHSDFEYEYQMALANKTLADNVETFFMMTDGRYSYLSSSLIKEIFRLGGDISTMVPPQVLTFLRKKMKQ